MSHHPPRACTDPFHASYLAYEPHRSRFHPDDFELEVFDSLDDEMLFVLTSHHLNDAKD